MFNIRKGMFETNSSSGDRYAGDDDYDNSLPSSTHSTFNLHIGINWRPDVTEERKAEIFKLLDNKTDELADAISDNYSAFEDVELDDFINDEIRFSGSINLSCENWDPGYKGDRYCPPEGPSCDFYPDGDSIVDEFNKTFKEVTITDILTILKSVARESDSKLTEHLKSLYAEGKVDYDDISYYDYDEEIPEYIDEIGDTFEVYVSIDEDKAFDNIW